MTREEKAYNYASKKNPSKYTVNEIIRHYDDGYKEGYKDAINKVHKWIEKWDVAYTHPLVMDAVHKELDEFMEEQQ